MLSYTTAGLANTPLPLSQLADNGKGTAHHHHERSQHIRPIAQPQ